MADVLSAYAKTEYMAGLGLSRTEPCTFSKKVGSLCKATLGPKLRMLDCVLHLAHFLSNLAFDLLIPAFLLGDRIPSDFAELFLDLATYFFSAAFYFVFVHTSPRCEVGCKKRRQRIMDEMGRSFGSPSPQRNHAPSKQEKELSANEKRGYRRRRGIIGPPLKDNKGRKRHRRVSSLSLRVQSRAMSRTLF